jgi:hypothetical protein
MFDKAAAVATVITALLALFLVWQGQRDRRRLREEERRRQAVLVTMSTTSSLTKTSDGEAQLDWCQLIILNGSDQAIHVDRVTLVQTAHWPVLGENGDSGFTVTDIPVDDRLVRPRGEEGMQLPEGRQIDAGVAGSDFAIVEFSDARSDRWRRRSDTYELAPVDRPYNAAEDLFQGVTKRVAPVEWLLATVPQWLAVRAARRRPDRVSLALRWCRATHGSCAPGEEDPWMRPEGAPALWGYVGLVPPGSDSLTN